MVFTNEESMIQSILMKSPLGKSHHSGLSFTFQCYQVDGSTSPTRPLYYKGNYDEIRNDLQRVDWKTELKGKNTEDTFVHIKTKLEEEVKKHIPMSRSRMGHKAKALWMSSNAMTKVKRKNAAYRRYLKTTDGKDYVTYARARNQAKWEIRRAKRDYEKKLARESKSNPKAFFKYANSKLKTRCAVPNLIQSNGTLTDNDRNKAEELNSYFKSVFTNEDLASIPAFENQSDDNSLEDIEINEAIVLKQLQNLKVNKSPGPDCLHPRLLKELSSELKGPLTILFQRSLGEGLLPRDWRDAHITPIYKKGKKEICGNYRPVSLTSIVCKMLERIIRGQAVTHLKQLLSSCQHGFMEGRSCVTQLLDTIDLWSKVLDEGLSLDAVYLDFAKAFDTVPHERLLVKLKSYGINGKVLKWLRSFLSERRQRVVVNGQYSSWAPVNSGIPQGSVLGPLLFICYVNDMPDIVHSAIRMFADDTKIFGLVNDTEDRDKLQMDLERLQCWADKWQLRFNATKCKVMHLGNSNMKYDYQMKENGNLVKLEASDCEKDLGVNVDKDLKFSKHAMIASNKANRIMGMIKRSFTRIDKEMFNCLFKSLVRPHLEYGNVVWSPWYQKDIQVIENVQRRACKAVTGLRDLDYEERLKELKLPSLVYRRLRGDLIEVYKYTHNCYDTRSIFEIQEDDRTRGNDFKIKKQGCRRDVRKRFFSLRTTDIWNKLPNSIVNASSLCLFKTKVDNLFGDTKYLMDTAEMISKI